MALENLSFETAGDEVGCAQGWTFACHSQRETAAFGDAEPTETFEWVTGYKTAFGSDITPASFDDAPEAVEDFEEEWQSNEVYQIDIVGTAALFDGTSEAYEDFQEDWSANQDYKFAFVGIGSDLAYASFDTAPEDYEDFEESWVTGYLYAFVGLGTDLTAAAFDVTPENFEDFEEDWTTLMVTI